jgi:hypothetical protein
VISNRIQSNVRSVLCQGGVRVERAVVEFQVVSCESTPLLNRIVKDFFRPRQAVVVLLSREGVYSCMKYAICYAG